MRLTAAAAQMVNWSVHHPSIDRPIVGRHCVDHKLFAAQTGSLKYGDALFSRPVNAPPITATWTHHLCVQWAGGECNDTKRWLCGANHSASLLQLLLLPCLLLEVQPTVLVRLT